LERLALQLAPRNRGGVGRGARSILTLYESLLQRNPHPPGLAKDAPRRHAVQRYGDIVTAQFCRIASSPRLDMILGRDNCLITRPRVSDGSGYDPQGPQGYYALFGSQLKRACALWHAKFVLGPLVIESADIASWTVTMGGPNWQVFTQYDFVRQEDIINAN